MVCMAQGLVREFADQGKVNILVRLVDIVDSQDGQDLVISRIVKGDSSTRLDTDLLNRLFREIKSNGNTEENTIG